ncbi:AAA family ATPase [Patescibacteria group bacterium]
MKIKSVRISNIFSFAFEENIEDVEPIVFGENLNILIGSNGAGKSNFIEIISQLFKRGIVKQENFNESIIKKENNVANFNKALTYGGDVNQSFFNYLQKNKFSDSEKKQIMIDIAFNEYDFDNIEFVIDKLPEIKKVFSKYGSGISIFDDNINIESIKRDNEISILLSQDSANQNPSTVQVIEGNTPERNFIIWYIEHFEFIKRIIEIHNKYEATTDKWPQLKNTFALIGCYRNYDAFNENYPLAPDEQGAINEVREKIKNESTKSGGGGSSEPAVFEFIKRKIAYRFNYLLNYKELDQVGVEEKIREEALLKNINDLLREYLNIEVFIRKTGDADLNHRIYFKDNSGNDIKIMELSAGEKGILHFITSLYGYDLKNGLMIIDEPELHLHPQIQQAYLRIIEKVQRDFDVQFIFATHSPLFIDINTISNVYRFYQEDKSTRIANPVIDEEDKDLVRILNYTNSARIFFSSKVILVEGDSDEFFYRKFWDYYKKTKQVDRDEKV